MMRPGMVRRVVLNAVLVVVAWAIASPAYASGGGGHTGSTVAIVGGLAVLIAAYLLANFVVNRLEERLLIVTGFEFVLLGMILGPGSIIPGFDVLNETALSKLMPVIALAAGWVGLLRGMDMQGSAISPRPKGTVRGVILHHLLPGAAVGACSYWFFYLGGPDRWNLFPAVGWREAGAASFVLACAAASDAGAPLSVVGNRYEVSGPVAKHIDIATRLGDVLVILAFGVLFCLFHVPFGQTEGTDPTMTANWFGIQVGIGVGLGALFTPFLGGDETPNGRFLAMVGIICFASGAAYFIQLSPLAVNVILGVVLVNFAKTGRLMRETLRSTEKPMNLVLFILAGALWRLPADGDAWTATALVFGFFLLIRLVAKWIASRVSAWGIASMRNDLFRGLLGQGEVTVAMAVSFRVVYQGPVVDIAYTAIMASVVVMDLVAPRVLRDLLVDAGDVGRERATVAAAAATAPRPNAGSAGDA